MQYGLSNASTDDKVGYVISEILNITSSYPLTNTGSKSMKKNILVSNLQLICLTFDPSFRIDDGDSQAA